MAKKLAASRAREGVFFRKLHFWNLNFFFLPKAFFWRNMKKNINNLSQGPPNQGFMQENVQKGDFLKKP